MKRRSISDLAIVSDRATCVLVDTRGTICWYCPERFDSAAIFADLLDEGSGGSWSFDAPGASFASRSYVADSGVLESEFVCGAATFSVSDWMPIEGPMRGVVRKFSAAPVAVTNTIRIRPEYGRERADREPENETTIRFPRLGLLLRASHPIAVDGESLIFTIPQGTSGWAAIVNGEPASRLSQAIVDASLASTLRAWNRLGEPVTYEGPYRSQVHASMRAIRQMTFAETGGVIAAATTSLPEVVGDERNYDYRYVWTRDASLISSAFVLFDETPHDAKRILTFLAKSLDLNERSELSPYYAVDGTVRKGVKTLALHGFDGSEHVEIGNAATTQFQLDAHGNVLLAAKVVYDCCGERPEWDLMELVAEVICKRWRDDDNGIWEEDVRKAYTFSKVVAARGLEFMASFSTDPSQAARWQKTAGQIRTFVSEKCMTRGGAFAVYEGSQEVDIASALFPLYSYCEPDCPEMLATIGEIERLWRRDGLFWRRLERFDSHREGAFLAASCWMAHYYAVVGNLERSRETFAAILRFQNDLGLFAEEAGVDTGEMLGNFPQTFVHSSFVCAVNGLKQSELGIDSRIR